MSDSSTEERLALIAEGSMLTLEQAVRELLDVADDAMRSSSGVKRPDEAHGGAYLSRWRFARLRKALGARPPEEPPPDVERATREGVNAARDLWVDGAEFDDAVNMGIGVALGLAGVPGTEPSPDALNNPGRVEVSGATDSGVGAQSPLLPPAAPLRGPSPEPMCNFHRYAITEVCLDCKALRGVSSPSPSSEVRSDVRSKG